MASPPYILVQIIHMQGGLKGKIQESDANLITLGRSESCTIVFPPKEPGVSREHARIEREGNQFKLTDVSKFGTFVNGKQVREAFLKNGDVIEFGPGGPLVSFCAEITTAPVAPHPPAPLVQPAVAAPTVNAIPVPEARVVYSEPAPERYVAPQPPVMAEQADAPVRKATAPLVIQYGPTIRTYRELPVILGSDAVSDFVIKHPNIAGRHAQLFYHQESYWIKDLTGQALVSVNGRKIERQTQLNLHDEIKCTPQGPTFRFMGEGRLAEVEAPADEPVGRGASPPNVAPETPGKDEGGNMFSKFIKGFRS